MSGAGYKQWQAGALVSQPDFQNYVQDQTVARFASVAARTSQLPAPTEGMLSTLDDTDVVQRYDGSSWRGLGVVPVGALVPWAGAGAPDSQWLACDGQAVSRTTYAKLFTVCGTTYGIGNGSTTFNLPNMQARLPVHLSTGDPDYAAMGQTGGAKTHTHPLVNPGGRQSTKISPLDPAGGAFPGARLRQGGASVNVALGPAMVGSTHDLYTYDTDPANGLNPYLVLNFIIRAL